MKSLMLSVLLLASISLFAQSTSTSPNIVLILADDLGYNDLSCYRDANTYPSGNKPPTSQTPNIDKLAQEGMRFTDFYAGAAVCSPSRSAIISGRNCTRVGIYNWIPDNSPMHLRSSEITIAEQLKKKNYATAHFGKWHLTSEGTDQPLPQNQGYDYSFYAYNNAEPSHHNPVNYFRNGKALGELKGYACQLVANEALQWLDTRKDDSQQPFYINIWFNEPHLQVAAPEEFTKQHEYNAEYYGAIENMDSAIGRVVSYLEENNMMENTLILFSSDNGSRWDESNDPLRGEKCFNFEGGIRVPFIAKWQSHIAEGEINHFNGSFTDVFPTISSICDVDLPSDRVYDGLDISKQLFAKNTSKRTPKRKEPIFFYRYFHDPVCMLRDGDWCLLGYTKLIPWSETLDEGSLANIKPWHFMPNHMEYLKTLEPSKFELYNLKTDIEQRQNVASEHKHRVEAMKKKMLELKAEMVAEGGDWYK